MGAEPGEAYVVLGVPPDLDEDGCLELLDGLIEVGRATGTTLAGGDVDPGPEPDAGDHRRRPRPRAGGARHPLRRPGRATSWSLTGELGGAAAGLLLLERPEDAVAGLDRDREAALIARQLEPTPRLAAGRALAAAGATAMIDLSDGLGGDAAPPRRARAASGCGSTAAALPVAAGVAEVAAAARARAARAGRLGRRGLRAAGRPSRRSRRPGDRRRRRVGAGSG